MVQPDFQAQELGSAVPLYGGVPISKGQSEERFFRTFWQRNVIEARNSWSSAFFRARYTCIMRIMHVGDSAMKIDRYPH